MRVLRGDPNLRVAAIAIERVAGGSALPCVSRNSCFQPCSVTVSIQSRVQISRGVYGKYENRRMEIDLVLRRCAVVWCEGSVSEAIKAPVG